MTDTSVAEEKTRFYPADRAYRLVHGLVGLVLRWKDVTLDRRHWLVIVSNFHHAQHLGARFFTELARRAPGDARIEVIVDSRREGSYSTKLQVVAVELTTSGLPGVLCSGHTIDPAEIAMLERLAPNSADIRFEHRYPALLHHYQLNGNGFAAARTALGMLTLYNSHGYYHEAKCFIDLILPYFDVLVGNDEVKRLEYASKINTSLFMTSEPVRALSIIAERAAPYLTKPHLLANLNYILAMHHLRYADIKDINLAEQHILQAVAIMRSADDGVTAPQFAFRKVFIDNGLAFLRARQGRHDEALELCESGYAFLIRKMGEDRHRLHRSVLLYNIAQVYVMLGRLDEGLEHYRRAIAIDPNYSEYYNEVGNILQEQGRFSTAIEYYGQAIKCSAPYSEVYFNKAVCHARLDELNEALACFDISLDLNPQQPEAQALRADTCRELGKSDLALGGYDTAIRLGYDASAVWINRAVLHYNDGSYDLALADMDRVIARDAHTAGNYENRAIIHRALNREDLYSRDMALAARYSAVG